MAGRGKPTCFADFWQLRAPERRLLLWALLIALLGYLMLLGAGPKDGLDLQLGALIPFLVYLGAFLSAHLLLVLARFRGDQLLLPLAALLSAIGLIAQSRTGIFASPAPGLDKLILAPLGVALMLSIAIAGRNGRYRLATRATWLWAGLSLLLIALVLATGQRYRGAVYGLGFITPTELLKLTMVLFTAAFIDRHLKSLSRWPGLLPPLRRLWPLLLVWGLLLAMLLLQRDLGLVLILGLTLLAVLAAGTQHPGYLLYGSALAAAAGAAVINVFAHGQRRIDVWLNPFSDPTGAGWQVLQGLSGMYAGGLWGEGFSEARPRYTPIAESDLIYAVWAEELGFVGSLLLLLLFGLLLARLLTLAARARTPFGVMAATGVATVLSVQTLLNIGGVTKALPLTGITLPLISHGGSSLLTVFASLGLVLAISDGEPVKSRKGTAAKASNLGRSTGKSAAGHQRSSRAKG
ncbi:MAG: FtsW/RodA/SpoVE family cell cycle protein [Lamprobacter sp.]|uniref:FtsW/RodA/SpoVE family cell cycle protein n=1 Tax=Lamprobacter sp. TaxID=3100796 RepID=UPI002B2579BE|nr:FtsW/RodA/SpoVE family cell cycle protein [Lamprobacter sp.]MEA3638784.1 FtsW/RodA/SpoVE family cell cycle protein [Lamprobacter sp.]